VTPVSQSSNSTPFRLGIREAVGVPAGVLAATYIGFGALANGSDVPVWAVVASTFALWALPGQLVMVDMWALGAPAIAILLAVMLTNARFLPMTVTLMPLLRDRRHSGWSYYLAAQCVAMTSWAICIRRFPDMPAAERLPYFIGLSAALIVVGAIAGTAGFYIADSIPHVMQIGMVFLAPVYFFVFLIVQVRTRLAAIALICGGMAGPLFYLVTPQWSLLIAGVVGGTAAFSIHKLVSRTHA
jgi:predicted branched-subunit amino acid permease